MSYKEDISKITDISFEKILKLAKSNVPEIRKTTPWIGLGHGVKLLTTDQELAQYLAAYGSMHRDKINTAFEAIKNPYELFEKDITIIDWGCGQGLATICFFDYMRRLGIEPNIAKIILVDPSDAALSIAHDYLKKYSESADIHLINKYINDVNKSEITPYKDSIVFHFFSNILDIPSVDLDILSNLIKCCIHQEQLFFCTGPLNSGASRIADFAKKLNIQDEDILGKHNGQLSTHGTISMLVFHFKAEKQEVIKVEYYHHRKTDLGNNTALKRILSDLPKTSKQTDAIILFYRAVVMLERMKSANITDVYNYPYTLEKSNKVKFNIDIQDNTEFEQIFIHNADKSVTKWPKNLNIGLSIHWDNKTYRLMEYVYPYEDLKSIDITKQYISVDLSMFGINDNVADALDLTNDIVEVITDTLSDSKTTLPYLESILQDAIGHSVRLENELSLALTTEAPILAQINSELKNLTGHDYNTLTHCFLNGNIDDNLVGKISEDEIINVLDMDESQRHAIATALNSKISVITGPPGTGKTQMIINLLANALLNDKKVLIASKNNKAIDNIKERFDQIDDYQYLIRFGSKDMNKSKLIPSLQSLMDNIPGIQFDKAQFQNILSNYEKICLAASEARKLLGTLVRLTDEITELKNSLNEVERQKEAEQTKFNQALNTLQSNNKYLNQIVSSENLDLEKISIEIKKDINYLQAKNCGLSKLFFNLFSKKNYAAHVLNYTLSLPTQIYEWITRETSKYNVLDFHSCDDIINYCQTELQYFDRIKSYSKELSNMQRMHSDSINNIEQRLHSIKQKIKKTQKDIKTLSDAQDQLIATIQRAKEYISNISGDILSGLIKSHLTNPGTRNAIARYKNYISENIPGVLKDLSAIINDTRKFVDAFKLNSVTNLSVKSAFPLQSELFDMLIIDEASQCDIASAIPLIYRAKQLVVIGDPMQLRHITCVTNTEEQIIKEHFSIDQNPLVRYVDYSLWDYCNDLITSANNNNTHVVLDCHYRCHPQIIGYSIEQFYLKRLGTMLKVYTKDTHPELKDKGIIWVDIVGKQNSPTRNVNEAEAEKAISLAADIAKHYPDISIGIISPFRHQAEYINSKIPAPLRERIVSDTVHKFQGDERDVIIYTTVVTDNSPENKIKWIDKSVPNLVNVAVTRAKCTLYIVGNRKYIKEHSNSNLPLGFLVDYSASKASATSLLKEIIIIDTNIFVNCPDILEHIDSSKQIIISAKVIDELDKLKVTLDDSKKRNVELALRNINRLFRLRSIRMECADIECLPIDFSRKNPDNLILSVALKYRNQNPILLTSDNGLQLKAKGMDIKTISLKTILNQ